MESEAIREAARLLAQARNSSALVDRLPEGARPRNASDAYAIQLETAALLGDRVAGWKVAHSAEYELLVGILIQSRLFQDGASLPSGEIGMKGVEAEIAFRFNQDLVPRERRYGRAEIVEVVTALPAIEIVDTRFADFRATPLIDRAADFMSSGGFVAGPPCVDWKSFDLDRLEVCLTIDGVEVVRHAGGHVAGDPLSLAIAFCNELRLTGGVREGQVVTTGTLTGLHFAKPNSAIRAVIGGIGAVNCRFSS